MLIKLPFRGASSKKFKTFLASEFPVKYIGPLYEIIQNFPEHFEVWRYKSLFGLTCYKIAWKSAFNSKKPVNLNVLMEILDHYGYYDVLERR